MIVTGFHHIALTTADAARADRFYGDVLGLTRLAHTGDGDRVASWFGDSAGAPGTLIEIEEQRDAPRGRSGAGGIHHHAFMVETAEAQLKWKRWLTSHGVMVSGPLNRGYFRSIYFTDPDGQVLEIATRGPGYDLDEPIDALGAAVVLPPDAELRGRRDDAAIRARTHDAPVDTITDDMRLAGLHHISGVTDDVERIGEFYEAALGLRLVKRSVNQDDRYTPHWFWANYDGARVAPASSLTMFGGWTNGGSPLHGTMKRAVAGTGQTRHIAFRARDEEALAAHADHLRSLGVATSRVTDTRYFRSMEFSAPDGLAMRISTDNPDFGQQ